MKFRMRHLAASVIERDLSEKSHLLTGFEIGFQKFSVKKQQFQTSGIILDLHLKQAPTAVRAAHHLLAHHSADN